MRNAALLVLSLGFATAAAAAAVTVPATTQIYQQRTADGRLLLTDRPDPTALTERAWQMPAEDPAAARQRARDVQDQAQAVSERVQRRLIEQERLAEMSAQRRYAANLGNGRSASGYDDSDVDGVPVLIGGPGLRSGAYGSGYGGAYGYGNGAHGGNRSGGAYHGRGGSAGGRVRGSAAPGSR